MKVNSKQMAAVLTLPARKRFEHFIKLVADREQVWRLYKDGWATAQTDGGEIVFPFWPAVEYAQQCAENEWSNYHPKVIPLSDFMDDVLPQLKIDKIAPSVFYTPSNKGVVVPVDELFSAIESELENYSVQSDHS